MRRTEILQGVRMLKFRDVFGRCEEGGLSKLEAAELLGVNERTFRRWCRRFDEDGEAGLLDRRLGKPSPKRVPAREAEEIEALYRERYQGFTAKHFHEHAVRNHGLRWGYTWTKTYLQERSCLKKAPRRGAHRRKRQRKPLPGMMLHQDGSRHHWVPDLDLALDLIVTLDDATGVIYSAFLVEEEGTFSSLRGLAEVFAPHGLPCSLYTDRASHYFFTPKAGEKADPHALTQVGRALAQLGIEHIAAYSPQARGRSERTFRTLQDRLPKELALECIADVETANRFIAETFLPTYNARFAVAATEPGTAFVAVARAQWQDVLCVQEERIVQNDNTVLFQGRRLQIPPSGQRPHFVKAKVRVHQYPDGTLAIFHGPRRIAGYSAQGSELDDVATPSSMTPCSPPSRRGLARAELAALAQRRPALTATARGVPARLRVGTKKRPSGRTKKLTASKQENLAPVPA
jgi:transposase